MNRWEETMPKVLVVGLLLCLVFGVNVVVAQTTPPASAPAVEAQVCTGVQERMPVGTAQSFSSDIGQVYLWCKVTGALDSTSISVAWLWEGKEMTTVQLPVKSSSWRTWSAKKILSTWTGKWEARIMDAQGNILAAMNFSITPSSSTPEPASEKQSQ
jgi:hypothetical protein